MLPISKCDWKLSCDATILHRQRSGSPHAFEPDRCSSLETHQRRNDMREWHKPTVQETESGMEVTSYLPAELDRA